VADVAVVIGNYQGAQLLPDCLESLAAQTRPPAEVIVADGASRDDSIAVARRLGARVLAERNGGLGYLYNRGAEAASSPLVLLLNNDVALLPDCLELLAAALDDDERRFAADPTQLDWEGARTIHARSTFRRGPLLRELIPGFRLDLAVPADETIRTVTANGGAMLVRRERLLDLGGFDERFFLEIEDLDLCWRAWLRGWESVYVPAAVVRHRVGAVTGEREHAARLRAGHYNLLRFALKCLPPEAVARVVAGELLRLPAHPRLVGPALLRVARTLPEILGERRALRPSRELYRWLTAGQPGEPPR
jgi:N-acetylglucosaminyl-diphospho-decaprenol L-rhamnosyltransferase